MDATENNVEPVTISDVLGLATWDRPRTDDELREFVEQRGAIVGM